MDGKSCVVLMCSGCVEKGLWEQVWVLNGDNISVLMKDERYALGMVILVLSRFAL